MRADATAVIRLMPTNVKEFNRKLAKDVERILKNANKSRPVQRKHNQRR